MELAGIKQAIDGIVNSKRITSICKQITKEFIGKIKMEEFFELLKQIKSRKIFLVKNQSFEQASYLRDLELCIEKKIDFYLFGHFKKSVINGFTCNNCTNTFEIDKETKLSDIRCPNCNSDDYKLNISATTYYDTSI